MRSLCNFEYYKAWKEKLYSRIKFFSSFHYRIFNGSTSGDCAIIIPANGIARVTVRLRRGPAWYMIGIKTGFENLTDMQGLYITLQNVGGYRIIDRAPLSIVTGTVFGKGDTFLPCNWQWMAGEDMTFILENTNNVNRTFRGIALGKNVGIGA